MNSTSPSFVCLLWPNFFEEVLTLCLKRPWSFHSSCWGPWKHKAVLPGSCWRTMGREAPVVSPWLTRLAPTSQPPSTHQLMFWEDHSGCWVEKNCWGAKVSAHLTLNFSCSHLSDHLWSPCPGIFFITLPKALPFVSPKCVVNKCWVNEWMKG